MTPPEPQTETISVTIGTPESVAITGQTDRNVSNYSVEDTLTGKVTTALSLSNDTLTVVVTGVSSTDTDGKLSVVYEGDYPGQKDVTVAEITYSVSEPVTPDTPGQ